MLDEGGTFVINGSFDAPEFKLIKQMFIVLLSFSESLARNQTKCLFLNDEPCMVRVTPIDLNPVELKYYPFMIN